MATEIQERDYSADERQTMAKAGEALPDGSFPIRTPADVENALRLWGHSDNPKEAKAHIIARAKALGATDKLPHSWHKEGRSYEADLLASDSAPAGDRLLETTELAEAIVQEDPDRHIVQVTLIRAGTSKNGNHYSPTVLQESAPLFEGARAFADHAPDDGRPERSVRDLVGYYRHPQLDQSGRLRANLHLIPGHDWLWNLLRESQDYPALCGLSIDALGDMEKGSRTVNRINHVSSVDVVTRPAAGGSFDRILQSDRPSHTTHTTPQEQEVTTEEATKESDETKDTQTQESHKDANSQTTRTTPPPQKKEAAKEAAQDLASLVEQQRRDLAAARSELDRVKTIINPAPDRPTDTADDVKSLVEEMKRDRDLMRAETILSQHLAEAKLPQPVETKIRKRFAGRTFETQVLEDSIADEKDTLAQLTASGQIHGLGFEKSVTVGMSEYEQLQAAFDALFDIQESEAAKSVPRLSGIREAFAIATGIDISHVGGVDRPIMESYARGLRAKVQAGRLSESEVILREADVTTATFSFLLGTSMNKRLLKDYQAWPSEWQKIANVVAIKDFKLQDRIRLGAFGSLSTVAEDAAYTTLTLADTHATYTPTKRGNLVQVTRETIINDDLFAIKQIPQKLAVAAAFTLAEFVYNLLAPNFGNIYDAHPLFDSINHLNTGVIAANLNTTNSGAALSSSALQTAVVKMRKQTNAASKPIGLKPRYVIVCPDLEFTAMTVLKSAGLPGGNNNDINPMMGYAEPIVAPQLNTLAAGPNSTSIWIAVADPHIVDTVEVGFIGGQANPVLLIQDMPLYGLNFSQDTISYKVRHEYGGAVVDYRGFYLGNN